MKRASFVWLSLLLLKVTGQRGNGIRQVAGVRQGCKSGHLTACLK
jgi:hypothetical protein